MHSLFREDFAFMRMDFLDEVKQLLKESGVVHFRTDSSDCFSREPATLVVGVKDLEVAAFDFDDQPQLLRELKLVSIVLGSAVNEVADVDSVSFQCLSNVGGAHELRYRLQVDMGIRTARGAIGVTPHFERSESHSKRVVQQEAPDERIADVQ